MISMKNLIVGSAGWRAPYGADHNILEIEKIKELIRFIEKNKFRSIDTAPGYADSELLILKFIKELKISTKINLFSDSSGFKNELKKINSKKINTLYFHDPDLIRKFKISEISSFISEIIDRDYSPGFSFYDLESLKIADTRLGFKAFYQVPLNIFDLKFLKFVSNSEISRKKIIFRSLFSRGLVFLNQEQVKLVFGKDYEKTKKDFELFYKIPFENKSMEILTYSLIKYITKKGHDLIVGLNSISETNYFIRNVADASENDFDWSFLVRDSKTINKIEDLKL